MNFRKISRDSKAIRPEISNPCPPTRAGGKCLRQKRNQGSVKIRIIDNGHLYGLNKGS